MNKPGRLLLALGLCGGLAASLWLWWTCRHNPNTHFLTSRAPADWIVYPNPANPVLHYAADSSAEFRREFDLDRIPSGARLQVCAFQRFQVEINHALVSATSTPAANWKQPSALEVPPGLFRIGRNVLRVTVNASNGPPALWLALQTGTLALNSDESWETSWAGAARRPARRADDPMPIGQGHTLANGENPWQALRHLWPGLLLVALVLFAGRIALDRIGLPWTGGVTTEPASSRRTPPIVRVAKRWLTAPHFWLLAAVAAFWSLLFLNNTPLLPRLVGYDVGGHLEYIHYLMNHHRLPRPDEGWSMYQAPLYYLAGAALLGVMGWSPASLEGITALRVFGLGTALVHVGLIRAGLRRLFPAQKGLQTAGVLLAAFLPAQVYLSHYVTNEVLSATLVTACFCLSLRLIQSPHAPVAAYAGLGACLGAALLTKMTALLAVPFVFGAGAFCAWKQCRPARPALLARVAVMAGACLLVAGWHYARVGWYFGTPWLGNWDPASGYNWWQDDGYRTSAYYLRFGTVFRAPFFSGFSGFADGIYSTLWGDALYGGTGTAEQRPPWNYDWMAAGILLAVVPSILLALGAGRALIRLVRAPRPEWLLLAGFLGTGALALVAQTLQVPSYAQVKAFYLLSALLPMSALLALGWEFLARRGLIIRAALAAGFGAWVLTSIAAFWIHSGSASARISRGLVFRDRNQVTEAMDCFSRATTIDPRNPVAPSYLFRILLEQRRWNEAFDLVRTRLRSFPNDATACADMAAAYRATGDLNHSIPLARHAVELAPDDSRGHLMLSGLLAQARRPAETVSACREGLRVLPLDASLHVRLGTALAVLAASDSDPSSSLPGEARAHLLLAGQLAATAYDWKLLTAVAWTLATHPDDRVRDAVEARRLAAEACRLSDGKDGQALGTLAAAHAAAGDFTTATALAERARTAAERAGESMLASQCTRLLEAFRGGKAFHEVSRDL